MSVVSLGCVQVSVTMLPCLVARRSCTGLGNSNDGGNGDPGVAQPTAMPVASAVNRTCRDLRSKRLG